MAAPKGRSHWKERNNPATGHPTEQSDGPADKQTVGQGPSEIDPSNGGHNQVTENKQHAGDVERSC
jgi:hypothetical protein